MAYSLYAKENFHQLSGKNIEQSFLQELMKVMRLFPPFASKKFAVNNIALAQSWDI